MNGNVAMKLTMEIQGHNSGVSASTKKPGEMVTWTSVWGADNNGRYARAKVYDTVAIALNKAINAMLGENEVVSGKRIVITFNGEWQSRKFMQNGKEETERAFYGKESPNAPAFNILDGIALEAARLRNDATQALRRAEKLRSSGQLALAYEAVAQFVANYAGVPLDLEKFLADNAADDAEFGAIAKAEADPEAAAAAHFARDDMAKGLTSPVAEPAEEAFSAEEGEALNETSEEEAQAPMEFGAADDEVLGPDVTVADESVAEEDAIMIDATPADETDVLDDISTSVQVEQAAAPQPTVPAFGTRPPAFANRPAFPTQAAAGSKPFSRPEPVRQAPQPVARPVPSEADRPSPPFGGQRGPRFF